MPRRMSFAKTLPQMRARTKDVTRRTGWAFLKPGDVVIAIEKGMGLAKGESQVVLHPIEVVSVRRESLDAIDAKDLEREGLPGMAPEEFFRLFGGKGSDIVTRIEFRHAETDCACVFMDCDDGARSWFTACKICHGGGWVL